MDTATDLLVPILLGLGLGWWLQTRYGAPAIVTVLGGIVGMVLGLVILYRRLRYKNKK
jgi:hypothetical protein